MTTTVPDITTQHEFDGWIEGLADEIAEYMTKQAEDVDQRRDTIPFKGYNEEDIESHIREEVIIDRDDLRRTQDYLEAYARTPVHVELSDIEQIESFVHGALVNEIGYNIVYFLDDEYLCDSVSPANFHHGVIDDSHPDPYLWLARYPKDAIIDEPMWFLPLESQADSGIWTDDELTIEIVWWNE